MTAQKKTDAPAKTIDYKAACGELASATVVAFDAEGP